MDQEDPKSVTVAKYEAAPSGLPLTVSVWGRDVAVYQVFDHEFRMIKSSASESGLYLAFFGIAFGLMTALLIVLVTVELKSARAFAAFVVGFMASLLASALLGIKAYREWQKAHTQIDYIEEQSRKRLVPMPPFLPLSVPYTQDLTKPEA